MIVSAGTAQEVGKLLQERGYVAAIDANLSVRLDRQSMVEHS
jgi:hypothetical protein